MNKLYFLLLLLLFGCSSAPDKGRLEPYEAANTYKGSFDKVWADIVEYFAINNYSIKTIDRSSGIIATEYKLSTAEFEELTDCSDLKEQVLDDEFISFNIFARREQDSLIKVIATTKYIQKYQVLAEEGININEFYCESNGKFEKKFFDFMDRKAND